MDFYRFKINKIFTVWLIDFFLTNKKISHLSQATSQGIISAINNNNNSKNVNMSPNENISRSANNDSNITSEDNTNTQNSDMVEVSSGAKQKRKACECQNCLK